MSIAALIAWVVTAGGGFVLLGTWLARGGPKSSKFSPTLIYGHFALAAAGLVVWIIYLFADQAMLAWIAFILLVPVALLGFTMLAKWLPTYRKRDTEVAEQRFPVAVVGAHGVAAVTTVVLVLLAAVSS